MLCNSALLQHRLTRVLPHIVDTLFLASGIGMLVLMALNPFTQAWLLAKFAGLVAYVILGTIAIKRGRTRNVRLAAFVAALSVFAYIVGVGLSKSAASWLAVLLA